MLNKGNRSFCSSSYRLKIIEGFVKDCPKEHLDQNPLVKVIRDRCRLSTEVLSQPENAVIDYSDLGQKGDGRKILDMVYVKVLPFTSSSTTVE